MFARRMYQWAMVWLVFGVIILGLVISTNFGLFWEAVKSPLQALVDAALPLILNVALIVGGIRLLFHR